MDEVCTLLMQPQAVNDRTTHIEEKVCHFVHETRLVGK